MTTLNWSKCRAWQFVVIAFGFSAGSWVNAEESLAVSQEALALHQEALVFDGHNNLVRSLMNRKDTTLDSIDLTRFQQGLHTDIPRLRQGGLGAEFFATFVSTESVKKGTAVAETLEQIEAVKQLMRRYPDVWELAGSADDVLRLRKERKMAGLIAIENGDAISGSLAVLRSFHQAGVRCLALTHDDTHSWADAALDKPQHGGLSKFGEQVVREANRLGIVLDLSHASEESIRDTLAISNSPVLFSHSGADKIAPHPRNLSDETLRLVGQNGGVVHVNFFAAFLTRESIEAYLARSKAAHDLRKSFQSEEQYRLALNAWLKEHPLPTTTVSDVVDHIAHIASVAGIDHVGLGSNFDGMVSVPKDLDDVSCFPRITQELLNRGFKPEQIRKVLGENTLRVLGTVERIANAKGPSPIPVSLRVASPAAQ